MADIRVLSQTQNISPQLPELCQTNVAVDKQPQAGSGRNR